MKLDNVFDAFNERDLKLLKQKVEKLTDVELEILKQMLEDYKENLRKEIAAM